MNNDENVFRHESLQDRETIVELLSALQQGLRSGTLTFCDDDDEITLKPSGLLNFFVKASSSRELNVLDVRISWQGDESGQLNKELNIKAD